MSNFSYCIHESSAADSPTNVLSLRGNGLTLSLLKTLQQTTFLNIVAKVENAHVEQFLLLPQSCFFLFNNYTFIYRKFPSFYLDVLKVVCCRCVVCRQGLRLADLSESQIKEKHEVIKQKLSRLYVQYSVQLFVG